MSMYIGEALVGDGNEISHIDLLIGDKNGPVGTAFANALAEGFGLGWGARGLVTQSGRSR